MTELTEARVPWRIIGWGGAVALLAIPFVAMRFSSEVNWSASDFISAGALFAIVGGGFELAVRASNDRAYRAGAALALVATFLTIWANLAVGIVGSEGNPANIWFFGALVLGIIGSCVARFRASGTSIATLATAVALWSAFGIALMSPTDEPFVNHGVEFAGTSVFALLFLGSAALFRRAAQH